MLRQALSYCSGLLARRPAAGDGFRDELAFWDRELSGRGPYAEDVRRRSTPSLMPLVYPHYLEPLLEEVRARTGAPPRVLDAGSGPLSMWAHGAEQDRIALTCSDALADAYRELLARHGLRPRYPLVQCAGEALSARFGEAAFDVAWMHNALDHTQDPGAVVRELVRVLAPGGYLVVQGWCREGTAERFIGLHRHDLWVEPPGRLMLRTLSADGRRLSGPVAPCDGLGLELLEASAPSRTPRTWMKLVWRKPAAGYASTATRGASAQSPSRS
ncbi:class I SAM-dependent methyltransferase [Anaeromyxobacter dehalogenans]|uniref:Methyltransferase type 11 n=1 Tax=Anaeromyxobacter dehalogenans (strain 2CP-C) TaxID=290397 RepID=Q2IMF8_ANADE|nr:class I SAM-dependent methyltransferase [Anaeromyxobacter dehalogenans]ABC79991.1 Methyltransferase type 11 [Anaeromyxobacter dehalogenans 2CP-C]